MSNFAALRGQRDAIRDFHGMRGFYGPQPVFVHPAFLPPRRRSRSPASRSGNSNRNSNNSQGASVMSCIIVSCSNRINAGSLKIDSSNNHKLETAFHEINLICDTNKTFNFDFMKERTTNMRGIRSFTFNCKIRNRIGYYLKTQPGSIETTQIMSDATNFEIIVDPSFKAFAIRDPSLDGNSWLSINRRNENLYLDITPHCFSLIPMKFINNKNLKSRPIIDIKNEWLSEPNDSRLWS